MTPQANTKIERAVEAFESLAIAVVEAQRGNSSEMPGQRRMLFDNVQDAREELRNALAEFITPTLRVVQ